MVEVGAHHGMSVMRDLCASGRTAGVAASWEYLSGTCHSVRASHGAAHGAVTVYWGSQRLQEELCKSEIARMPASGRRSSVLGPGTVTVYWGSQRLQEEWCKIEIARTPASGRRSWVLGAGAWAHGTWGRGEASQAERPWRWGLSWPQRQRKQQKKWNTRRNQKGKVKSSCRKCRYKSIYWSGLMADQVVVGVREEQ